MKPLIQPEGMGDLLVVKQNLLGYRRGDIAQVVNVMATQVHEHQTRRLRREELSVIERTERTEERLRDVQATERFELEQETQRTIQSETQFEAGAEVSAHFGPVSLSGFVNFSTGESQTESQRSATTMAREVVDRALNRIVEKSHAERKVVSIDEFEERDLHRFDNAMGGNKTGIYYWLDKIVRLKVVNYGKRVYYKFIVPTPAAFYVFAMTERTQGDTPKEPVFPQVRGDDGTLRDMTPADVTRDRWRTLVTAVRARGVKPPPARYRYVTKHFLREFNEATSHFTISPTQIEVPKGYVAMRIDQARAWKSIARDEQGVEGEYDLDLIVGKTSREYDSGGIEVHFDPDAVADDAGPVPAGVQFDGDLGVGTFSVYCAVRIKCKLDPQAFRAWQMEVYDAIVAAYQTLHAEYEEKLSQAQARGGFRVAGRHPVVNREIERTELMKSCITMWTGFRFDGLPGITHDEDASPPANYPEVHVANALELAPEIELMMNGFDWAQMSYRFLPYFWERKRRWLDLQELEDPDPLFQAFLQAGAAIVLVPCKPDYTRSVLYYQLTGTLAPQENVPEFHTGDIDDTIAAPGVEDTRDEELVLYQSYVREVEQEDPVENLDREIVIDPDDPDAWVVALPTSHVYLDPSMVLPEADI